jgi:hypothetical protein
MTNFNVVDPEPQRASVIAAEATLVHHSECLSPRAK